MSRYIEAVTAAEVISEKLKVDIQDLVDIFAEISTADVAEVKHGHWIKRLNEKKCSVCNFIYYSNNDDFNYCANCGAKMDERKKK